MHTQIQILSDDEIDSIHAATLQILSQVGVILTHAGACQVLQETGAEVRGRRVYFPEEAVERALQQCPTQFRLRGRMGKEVIFGNGSTYWHNLGGARDVYEPFSRTRRPALVRDVIESARLLDALPNATTVTPFFTPQDVPGEVMSLAMYRHALSQTTKPLHGPGAQTAEEVHLLADMAAVVGTPGEFLTMGISPVSPLLFPDHIAAAIIETARLGIPFGPLPCPNVGGTAPMSLAGALAQQNAEMLAAVILAQCVHPGLPILYSGRLAMLEMRTGNALWGGVELGMVSAATVQLAHRYRLPANVYGLSTNSHTLDLQNGYERAMNALLPALAGADELSGIGEMAGGTMGCMAQMVIDDEIAAGVLRIRRGFAVNEDTLALPVIAAVMDGDRNFLGQRHTVRYLRAGEVLQTKLAERGVWDEWERNERKDHAARAQAQAELLLKEHEVVPLAAEQERELEQIMRAAENQLAGRSPG
jgi:trimethylamine---corrinoid protein Co-methyltransferase